MRRPLALLALVPLTLVAVACGGDDDGGAADPDDFTSTTARTCSDLVNDIDYEVVVAGEEAAFAVVEISLGDDVDADELTATADDLDAHRELLVGLRDQLAEIEPEPGEEPAWNTVVESVDPTIDRLAHHTDLLRTGDAASVRDGFEPVDPGDVEAVEAALVELGLFGRDCEVVYSIAGNDPEHAEFLAAAASACTTIVNRRTAEGYSTDLVIEAVGSVHAGEPVEPTSELVAEVEYLAAEWQQTADDLDAVPTDDVTDEAAWNEVLAATHERVEAFERRLAALEDGDQEAITEVFTPGNVFEHPGLGELGDVGLDRRDCRSIQA